MKITRKQLRKIIIEAFRQKVPVFEPFTQKEFDDFRSISRKGSKLTKPHPDYSRGGKFEAQYNPYDPSHHVPLSLEDIKKLEKFESSGDPEDRAQAIDLFKSFGSKEFDADIEDQLLKGQQDAIEKMSQDNLDSAISQARTQKDPQDISSLYNTFTQKILSGDPDLVENLWKTIDSLLEDDIFKIVTPVNPTYPRHTPGYTPRYRNRTHSIKGKNAKSAQFRFVNLAPSFLDFIESELHNSNLKFRGTGGPYASKDNLTTESWDGSFSNDPEDYYVLIVIKRYEKKYPSQFLINIMNIKIYQKQ